MRTGASNLSAVFVASYTDTPEDPNVPPLTGSDQVVLVPPDTHEGGGAASGGAPTHFLAHTLPVGCWFATETEPVARRRIPQRPPSDPSPVPGPLAPQDASHHDSSHRHGN
jgi:hypothetical protein